MVIPRRVEGPRVFCRSPSVLRPRRLGGLCPGWGDSWYMAHRRGTQAFQVMGPPGDMGPSSPCLRPWEFESKSLLVSVICSRRGKISGV